MRGLRNDLKVLLRLLATNFNRATHGGSTFPWWLGRKTFGLQSFMNTHSQISHKLYFRHFFTEIIIYVIRKFSKLLKFSQAYYNFYDVKYQSSRSTADWYHCTSGHQSTIQTPNSWPWSQGLCLYYVCRCTCMLFEQIGLASSWHVYVVISCNLSSVYTTYAASYILMFIHDLRVTARLEISLEF